MPPWFVPALACLPLLACVPPMPDPAELFLDRIEAGILLPPGARPFSAYSRSYFKIQDGAKVMGVYSTLSPPGRRWVPANPGPFVMDGGCAIITVIIDVRTERIEHAECNGVG